MGTRGIYGLVVNGEVKSSYNHFDSYPTGLGADIVKFVKGIEDMPHTFKQAQNLTLVNEDDEAPSGNDWYTELKDVQGELAGNLAEGYMTDGVKFGNHSLFCEWGYLVDLDNETVEVYRGFQEEAHTGGRWSDFTPEEGKYHGIKLIATIPFSELNEEGMGDIEKKVYAEEN